MVGGTVLLTVGGLALVRRLIPHHRLKLHNDVAGPIFGTLGVIYAVLLAFVVVIAWGNFDRAAQNVEREADSLSDLSRDAECFPLDFRQSVRSLISEYAKVVMQDEWRLISRGQVSTRAEEIEKKLWLAYGSFSPRTEAERIFFEESVRKLNNFGELRMMRLIESRTGVHPLLWTVLILGGLVTIAFTFFFGAENLNAQMTMSVLLSILISLILFTILNLDFPFSGDIRISSAPFRQLIIK